MFGFRKLLGLLLLQGTWGLLLAQEPGQLTPDQKEKVQQRNRRNLWHKDKPLGKLEALRQAQLEVLKNPERVIERTRELRAELAKRGVSEEELRGPKGKKAEGLPDGGAIKPGQPRRSPPAWWAAFVLSDEVEAAKR